MTLIYIRLILIPFGIILLVIPAFRNYEIFFPRKLRLRVFYDADGLEAALRTFSEAEARELRIDQAWKKEKYYQIYLDRLNALARKRHLPSYVKFTEAISAAGEVNLYFRKMPGWQKYKIEEIKGFLVYKFNDSRNDSIFSLRDEFSLQDNEANIVKGSFKDIFYGWAKIIQPRFDNSIYLSPTRRFQEKHLSLIAITKIRFFPFIKLGKTVYFVEDTFLLERSSTESLLIPVGYGLYEELD